MSKKTLSKSISLALALIMAAGLICLPAPPASAASEPSDWAIKEVNRAKELGLVPQEFLSLYSDATTRAEFCALAVLLYENVTGAAITGRSTFSDTSDVNVEKAAYIEVVNGVGGGRFDPGGALTREQAATMLARLAKATGNPLTMSAATFADTADISPWALEAVGQCQAAEIMGGVGANTFSPAGVYQRQQSIATILRLYDALNDTGNEPDPVNDPISTKALTGWWQTFQAASPLYAAEFVRFKDDGTFDIYYILSVRSSYTNWSGFQTSYNASASQVFRTGKYRVRGNVIEFYDVERATNSAYASSWEDELYRVDAFDKLRSLDSSYYTPVDNFTYRFEFYDADKLRLVSDTGADWDFTWDDDAPHNAQIPTFMIPEPSWPTEYVSPDMPEFAGKGRLREVGRYYPDEDEDDEHRTYFIKVYRTDKDAAKAYVQSLANSGWIVESPDFNPTARKGLYNLRFTIKDDEFTIYCKKDKQGVWPVEWFGTAVSPPQGCEMIGEINTKYWEKKSNFSLSVDCAGVDEAALERYYDQLRSSGFSDSEDTMRTKLYKFARIDGDMYRIWVETYRTTLDISQIHYTMEYFEDTSWPTADKAPPAIVAPDNCDLLGKISVYEGWGGRGSFYFKCQPMDDAAISRYFAKLEANGWSIDEGAWHSEESRIIQITWNGTRYDCEIKLDRTRDGLTEFYVIFNPVSD